MGSTPADKVWKAHMLHELNTPVAFDRLREEGCRAGASGAAGESGGGGD